MAHPGRTITIDADGRVQSVDADRTQEQLRWLAWLLDSSIPIPGTKLTIGVDALIGLIPVLGDFIGVALSSYIINEAARLGAPRIMLARMAWNVLVEGLVGVVPLAGDVFDAAWKANQRNVGLLTAWVNEPKQAVRSSRLFAATLIAAIALLLTLLGTLAFLLLRWIVQQF